jgi:acyl-CoA synthetase (AMP-forming)/AMP-acid ligase II
METGDMSGDGETIAAAIRASASQYPDKACLVSDNRTVTYRELAGEMVGLAGKFKKMGVSPGDRVAILDVDSVEYLEIVYALALMGAIAIPLNYRLRVPELQYQLRHSGARLLLAGARYSDSAQELSSDCALGWRSVHEFTKDVVGHVATDDLAELKSVDAGSPFAICYTSGTTGRPKGAILSQRSACLRGLKFIIEFGLKADDVMHVTSPMFHVSAINLMFTGILRGNTLAIHPQFHLQDTMRCVRRNNVTFLLVIPTMLTMMVEEPDFGPDYFGSVRLMMYTAAPMSPPLLRKLMSVYRGEMVQSFGQTEDLPQAILNAEDHRAAFAAGSRQLESIGRAAIGVELKICDNEGRALPAGMIGEIATRGGTEMSGYWNDPAETARTLHDGWIYSGDLGYQDERGYVYLAGRKKHLIIRGGENVYPAEVERVLLEAPGVRDAVVIGLPDPRWGEVIAAAIVPSAPDIDIEALQTHCKAALASYKCPDRIFLRDSLPYNAAGKVQRHLLQAEFAGGSAASQR